MPLIMPYQAENDIISGATPESDKPEYWNGDIFWVTPEDVGRIKTGYWLRETKRTVTMEGYNSCGTTIAPRDSIILTKRAPIGQLAVLDTDACSNQGCLLLTTKSRTDSRFFYYFLSAESSSLQALGRGSTFMELSVDDLKTLHIPVPNLEEQQTIADHLDRETAKLDALIAAKERLLGLLAEKRRALITRAVTRGLNPDIPMRDSGIPWLGQVPEDWKIERLKFHLCRIEQGWSPQCDNTPADEDEWGVMKAGCVNGLFFDENDNKRLPKDLTPLTEYELRPGDVLMSRANTTELLGSTVLVQTVRPRLLLCKTFARQLPLF